MPENMSEMTHDRHHGLPPCNIEAIMVCQEMSMEAMAMHSRYRWVSPKLTPGMLPKLRDWKRSENANPKHLSTLPMKRNRRVFSKAKEIRPLTKLSTLSKPEVPTGSLKRKLEGGEDHSVTNAERMSQIAFVRALKDSRRADKENTDHLVMRQYTKPSFSEEANGAKAGWEAEIERIGTADEWAKFTDWKLIRKVMNIGFHVYKQDGCGGIKFGWSDPMDDTNKRLVMVGVLFDGVHYDLIVFGEPTDAQLNGFV